MIGHVLAWNPDCNAADVTTLINNAYRSIVDLRLWAGLLVKGQVSVPNVYSTGTVQVTYGDTRIVGFGTTFTPLMIGMQFRVGFTTGFANIVSVQDATHLTLDLPWGNQSYANVSFQILNNIVQLGYNVKKVLEFLNQRQGYRCITNIPQAVLNNYDTWRTATGWTFLLSPREFDPLTGAQFMELYPAPTYQQTFPFLAYVQPPDLTDDDSVPYPFIRTDIIEKLVISQVLLMGGPKKNDYYDQFTAQWKAREAQFDIEGMMKMDDSQILQDMQWDFTQFPLSEHGSTWLAQHDGAGYDGS